MDKPRIAVIDDDQVNRYTISKILERGGYEVLQGDTGEAALRLAQTNPELMVLDVQLPDIIGYEVAARLKADARTASILILHLSATFVRSSDQVYGLEHGADAYLTHPIEPPVLLATIKALLRARSAELALRAAHEQLTLALDGARMGTWDRDLVAGRLTISEKCEQLLGFSPGEWPGVEEAFFAHLHPDDRDRVSHLIDSAVREHRYYEAEYRSIWPDQSVHWLLTRGHAYYDEAGKPNRMAGTMVDISPRKELEQQKDVLVSKLEEAITSRDEFLSIATHELKTPLTSLNLQLQLLDRQLRPIPDLAPLPGIAIPSSTLKRTVAASERESRRLGHLLDQLLDLTRIRAKRFDIERSEVDLGNAVHEVVANLSEQAHEAGSTISIEGEQHLVGFWDRSRIDQVLTNLLSNAIKYGKGKPIAVRLSHDTQKNLARLEVTDSGIGIAPEMQSRIFERFERAAEIKSTHGLGLGLFIVKQIVQAHSGTITVKSAPEQGSTFTVELPIRGQSH
ncbi:MAG TPA: ATP-binding protein [Bdellovibrionota bacterium]|nr:ATP-binding protein [Bdellovibrionota bacterium]